MMHRGFKIIDRTGAASAAMPPSFVSIDILESEFKKLSAVPSGDEPTSELFAEKVQRMRERLATPTMADAMAQKIAMGFRAQRSDSGAISSGIDLDRLLDLLE